MSELTKDEFWFISIYFKNDRGFSGTHRITDISIYMRGLSNFQAETTIASLVKKNVLSLSPDGYLVKFTDFGIELFQSMNNEQKEWESKRIIPVITTDRGEIVVRAGEFFTGNRVLRNIISLCQRELCIIDPYVGELLFDLLESKASTVRIRIITSERVSKGSRASMDAFCKQYPKVEVKIRGNNTLHDRFVIVDGAKAFLFGHSLKDLGKKDTHITTLQNVSQQVRLFEERWKESI